MSGNLLGLVISEDWMAHAWGGGEELRDSVFLLKKSPWSAADLPLSQSAARSLVAWDSS